MSRVCCIVLSPSSLAEHHNSCLLLLLRVMVITCVGYSGYRCEVAPVSSTPTPSPTAGATGITCPNNIPCGKNGSSSGVDNPNDICCRSGEVCAESVRGGQRGTVYSTSCIPDTSCTSSASCGHGLCGEKGLFDANMPPGSTFTPLKFCLCPTALTGYTGAGCDVPVQSSCPSDQSTCGGTVNTTTGAVAGGTCCTADEVCISDFSVYPNPLVCTSKSTLFSCSGAGETPCGFQYNRISFSGYSISDNRVCCSAGQQCVLSVLAEADGTTSYADSKCQ